MDKVKVNVPAETGEVTIRFEGEEPVTLDGTGGSIEVDARHLPYVLGSIPGATLADAPKAEAPKVDEKVADNKPPESVKPDGKDATIKGAGAPTGGQV